jgi:hypothetical protein
MQKLSLCLNEEALRLVDVWESGCMCIYIQVFFTSPLFGGTVPNTILTKFANKNLLMEFKVKVPLIL